MVAVRRSSRTRCGTIDDYFLPAFLNRIDETVSSLLSTPEHRGDRGHPAQCAGERCPDGSRVEVRRALATSPMSASPPVFGARPRSAGDQHRTGPAVETAADGSFGRRHVAVTTDPSARGISIPEGRGTCNGGRPNRIMMNFLAVSVPAGPVLRPPCFLVTPAGVVVPAHGCARLTGNRWRPWVCASSSPVWDRFRAGPPPSRRGRCGRCAVRRRGRRAARCACGPRRQRDGCAGAPVLARSSIPPAMARGRILAQLVTDVRVGRPLIVSLAAPDRRLAFNLATLYATQPSCVYRAGQGARHAEAHKGKETPDHGGRTRPHSPPSIAATFILGAVLYPCVRHRLRVSGCGGGGARRFRLCIGVSRAGPGGGGTPWGGAISRTGAARRSADVA